jgi:hypothetical protein
MTTDIYLCGHTTRGNKSRSSRAIWWTKYEEDMEFCKLVMLDT